MRAFVAALAILAIGTSSFAGDLQQSVEKAARDAAQQTAQRTAGGKNPYLWPGAALFVAGMTMTLYGFLHTSGGDFVSGEVSKESKTELGGAGLAVAGAGGALLYFGWQRARQAPSVTLGRGRIAIAKQIAW